MAARVHVPLRLAVIAATVVIAAGTGRADDGTEELIRRSVEARRAGDDAGALRLLRQAYAADQTPRAAGQLGLCEHALGMWIEAEGHVAAALQATNDPWVRKNRPVLAQDLEVIRSHLARVWIGGAPTGARVTLDGKDVGTLPLAQPIRVAAGKIEVAVAAPGFTTARKTISVQGGDFQNVALSAVPLPSAPTISQVSDKPVAPPEPAPRWRPAAKWIAWSAGAAALGVGIYGTLENVHLVHVFDDAGCSIKDGQPVMDGSGLPSSTCTSKRSDYESASHLAVGAFVGAAALGTAGAILWLTEPRPDAARTAWTACRPVLGTRLEPWLACSLRF